LRGTQTVAKDDKVLLPSPYYPSAHHKWFCLRVEKVGDTISYYIDRKLTLQYKDKNPLQGRRIALWTSGNGIMIARATIYYQQQSIVAAAPAITALTAELPAVPSEKLNWTVRGGDPAVALSALAPATPGDGPSLRAVDVGGGGNFAIAPHIEPFDALVNSRLTFQCKLDRGAAVNLYVKAKGITHAVRLTGPALADDQAGVVDLGSAPLMADNRWHSVNIDLGARLRALYPADTKIVVDELFVGNLGRDPYLQAGFSANTPGTSYVMRYFALRDNNNRLALLIEPRLQNVAAPTAAAQASTVAAR
jgi:hypothetical protein